LPKPLLPVGVVLGIGAITEELIFLKEGYSSFFIPNAIESNLVVFDSIDW